jgi:hypothetical protein
MVPLSGRSNLAGGSLSWPKRFVHNYAIVDSFTKGKIVLNIAGMGGEAGRGGGRQGGVVGEGEGVREEKALQVGEQHNYP